MQENNEQALQEAIDAHMAGKLEVAEHIYRAILQSKPNHPHASHNLGVIAMSMGEAGTALPLFKAALEANPSQGQFWLSYIDALIKEKQFDIARDVLSQGKKAGLAGERVDALEAQIAQLDDDVLGYEPKTNKLCIAIELRENGKYQEAQEWLNNFLDVEPSDAEGWSLLSQVYLLDKKDMDAEKALAKAISINPNLPSVYRNQARLLLKRSKITEALEKAKNAYDQSNEDPESWLVLAACLGANQKDQEALPLIEKALRAKPNYAEAFANRAMVRLRAKNITSAVEDVEKALSLKAHLVQLWGLLGSLRYQSKNLLGAIEALKKANALEPTNANYMVDLGEFLRQDNQVAEAISVLEGATKLAPENANAWINLGTALQQDNKIENAQAAYKKALAITPNSAEVCNNLGSIAKVTEDWESARKYFEQAITIKPDLAEAHFNLGIILKKLGRVVEAEASYAQAIRLKPDDIKARSDMLDCLYRMDKKLLFFAELDYLIKQDKANSAIGSLTSRSALRYGEEKANIFCNEPLKHVLLVDLKSRYNFDEIFVRNVKSILNKDNRPNKSQPLLLNGYQNSGNLFGIENKATEKIQKAIQLEIERYRINFENSQEGFIRKWPNKYSLFGWLISMKSGGELRPHIHENGWLSGSIYINVPPKSKIDSGNLVVALGIDSDTTNSNLNSKKVLDVVTGNMVLFPASLMHYTIPFESEEDRIVLAFDVLPK